MTTKEKFKTWLTTIYVSPQTGKHLTTPIHYAGGIKKLNELLNLPGDGIFDEGTDLKRIRQLIDAMPNRHKDYSSHFNAFMKFRNYELEKRNKSLRPLLRQSDVFKKQQVERAAVEMVIKHYEAAEYTVHSKEADNVGWDLEATKGGETLLLEVKGLSGTVTSVELSPNEYTKSKEKNTQYKLCIVTSALTNPTLEAFSFDASLNCWMNEKRERLLCKEILGARFSKE